MVIRLEPAYPNIVGSVLYNENKTSGGGGYVEIIEDDDDDIEDEEDEDVWETVTKDLGHEVATMNVPDDSSLLDEFWRLRELNRKKQIRGRKMKNEAFHMSVNPGDLDRKLSDAEMKQFVEEFMEKLGYGDQPYRLYKHDDIERGHYHVVTTRIGQDGKKINDSFEEARINKIMHELAPKYGYVVGLGENKESKRQKQAEESRTEKTEENLSSKKQGQKYPPFSRSSDVPISIQFKRIHNAALQWNFTTLEQYQAILARRFNVRATTDNKVVFFEAYRRPVHEKSTYISDDELGLNARKDIEDVIGKTKMSQMKSQRERVERVSKWAMENSDNFLQFRQKMEQKGIYTVVSWTSDGKPFGLTWLDMATHCAWKGSETDANLDWLKHQSEERGWEITMDNEFEKHRNDVPSVTRTKTDYQKNRTLRKKMQKRESSAEKKEKEARREEASAPSVFGHGGDQEAHNSLGGGSDDIYEDETKKIMSGKVM